MKYTARVVLVALACGLFAFMGPRMMAAEQRPAEAGNEASPSTEGASPPPQGSPAPSTLPLRYQMGQFNAEDSSGDTGALAKPSLADRFAMRFDSVTEELPSFDPAVGDFTGSSNMMVDEMGTFSPDQAMGLDGSTCGGTPVGTACAVCGEGEGTPPLMYMTNEIRVLTFARPRRRTLSFEATDVTDITFDSDPAANRLAIERYHSQGISRGIRANTTSVGFDISAAWAANIGRYLGRDVDNRDQFLEFSFGGTHHWNSTRTISGSRLTVVSEQFAANPRFTFGSLFSAFDPAIAGFNRADEHTLAYEANTNDFQLNFRLRPRGTGDRLVLHPNGRWRRECQPGEFISYLVGIRLHTLDERFRFSSRGSMDIFDNGANYVDTIDLRGDYLTATENTILGLQFGFDYIHRHCKWKWGMRAKAGPAINFVSQQSQVAASALGSSDPANGDPYAPAGDSEFQAGPVTYPFNSIFGVPGVRASASKNAASLLGEVGFVASYKIRPNMTLRASYDFLWMTGLARAPEQIYYDFTPAQTSPTVDPGNNTLPERVNDNGHTYVHGLTLGFEFLW